jgi:hypothetical protein
VCVCRQLSSRLSIIPLFRQKYKKKESLLPALTDTVTRIHSYTHPRQTLFGFPWQPVQACSRSRHPSSPASPSSPLHGAHAQQQRSLRRQGASHAAHSLHIASRPHGRHGVCRKRWYTLAMEQKRDPGVSSKFDQNEMPTPLPRDKDNFSLRFYTSAPYPQARRTYSPPFHCTPR